LKDTKKGLDFWDCIVYLVSKSRTKTNGVIMTDKQKLAKQQIDNASKLSIDKFRKLFTDFDITWAECYLAQQRCVELRKQAYKSIGINS
jgi:phosphopantetheine adenylyltransferase